MPDRDFAGGLSRPQVVARLLTLDEPWMVRRKLLVSVLDERWHRKQLSVDIRLPDELMCWASAEKRASVPVPITMLFKAPEATMGFDFRDSRGRALSLPLLAENLALSGAVIEEVAERICANHGEAPGPALDKLASAAREIDPNRAIPRASRALRSKSYCSAASRGSGHRR
jgi:hypothetical protein